MSSLSVLYIVKNEQDLIRQSLASIRNLADEIVIVDCESRDKTVMYCRGEEKAKVLSYRWVHDFSKVRNYALSQCTKDWVMYIDGDELVSPQSCNVIRKAIDSAGPHVSGIQIHVRDYSDWPPTKDGLIGSTLFGSPQIRIFRRAPGVSFSGRSMESVGPSIQRSKGALDLVNAEISHYLWHGKGEKYGQARMKYYAELGSSLPSGGKPSSEKIRDFDPLPIVEPRIESEPTQVAVIICAHNAANMTSQCLKSLRDSKTKIPFNLYLVDNGSSDSNLSVMREYPFANIIHLDKNNGHPKAKNIAAQEALKKAETKYLCFLDNDVILRDNWIDGMISVFESDPRIAAVGPITNSCGTGQNVSYQYNNAQPFEIANYAQLRNPESIFTDSLSGFCLTTRADVMREIGFFDETFGLFGSDDLDYCNRLRIAGYKLAVANKVFVQHVGRATLAANRNTNWHMAMMLSSGKYRQKWGYRPIVPQKPVEDSSKPRFSIKDKTSIIILTHNRLDMTQDCLKSIYQNTDNFEMIIVDNASIDGTTEWIKKTYPEAKLIVNEKNLGIPKGRNIGVKEASGSLLVLMDNDIVVQNGWFEELKSALDKGADIAGIEGWQLDSSHAASYKCSSADERFDYLGGACCIFRRKVFEKTGLFDEGFSPAYYEDPDICVRAKKEGFKLAFVPTSKIEHREHQTLVHGQKDFSYSEALSKSYVRFSRKMKGEIKETPEMLFPLRNKLRVLYLGMQWDYGFKERGLSFEHDNFYPSLMQWDKTGHLVHFDFVDLGKTHGIDKMSHMLLDTVQKEEPDVIFGVFFDQNHDPTYRIMDRIRQTTPTKVIGWFCDSHWRFDNFDRPWAEHLDFCVTTSSSAFDKYKAHGLENKVIKSQWGASPKYRKIEGVGLDVAVSFVGQPHGDRRQVIEHLRSSGINVQVYGCGWGQRLSFDEMVLMFNRSKINLNLNNASDARFKQIKGRNFEVPACGGFLLTEVAENLGDYYGLGTEIGVYNSTRDLVDRIKYWLSHEEERDAVAEAGYKRTMRDHTYQHRLDEIFSKARII